MGRKIDIFKVVVVTKILANALNPLAGIDKWVFVSIFF